MLRRKGFNAATEPIWSTEAEQREETEVKDAVFITEKVFREQTNMMLDTGSQSIIVSKRFIDRLGIPIERPARVITIDINGGRTVPLEEITNVPIQIGEYFWIKNVIVNDSRDFNVVLGNKFIAPAKGEIDYLTKTFAYFKDGEHEETPFTCWTRFEDPDRVYPMPIIRGNEEERD